ncbi:MAG: MBL fold metallo-hydrolase [Pseudomonadales bacterium]|nr:MBL fold metallo-hydrolase [Pseudomonadales bacterium]
MKNFILALTMMMTGLGCYAGSDDVGRYSASQNGFYANSYWLQGNSGLVLIDAQFLNSEAGKLVDAINKTGQKPSAILITHPHPDHYNGLALLFEQYGKIPVYATEKTIQGIKDTEAEKRAFWLGTYGPDYPKKTILPQHTLKSHGNVTIDGINIMIDDLGDGEASDVTVFYVEKQKQLFVGDLSYPKMHPWLAEGRSNAWLSQLAYILKSYPQANMIFPGHGEPGPLQQINDQMAYISQFQSLLRNQLHDKTEMDKSIKDAIIKDMKVQFPGYALEGLLDWNIDAVVKEVQPLVKITSK